MKRTFLMTIILFCSFSNLFGQRFGYIDTELILSKMSEYTNAKKELDQASLKWQNEIQAMHTALITKKQNFEAEKVLFTESMRKQKQAEISTDEAKIRSYQQKIFGFEGLLFQKREALMRPIQEKIYAVTEKLARKRKLSFIFDKSSDVTMIYADPTHDYTDMVLEQMNLKVKP